jgi:hypothetical protein
MCCSGKKTEVPIKDYRTRIKKQYTNRLRTD